MYKSIILSLFLIGCSSTPMNDAENTAYNLVVMAANAQKIGDNRSVIKHFEKAISIIEGEYSLTGDVAERWKEMIANILWEDRKYSLLKTYSQSELSELLSLKWWCLILENQQRFNEAKSCWIQYGDTERAVRSIRTKVILDEFSSVSQH